MNIDYIDKFSKLQYEKLKECGMEYSIWITLLDVFTEIGIEKQEILLKLINNLEVKEIA